MMSAEPANKDPLAEGRNGNIGAEAKCTSEPREMMVALGVGLELEELPPDRAGLSLPNGLWDSGPPLLVRNLNDGVSLANPAFRRLSDALIAARALSPAEDLAVLIEGLGQPYREDLILTVEDETQFFLVLHDLVPGKEPNSPYVISRYFPADDVGHRLQNFQDLDDRWRDLTRLVSDIVWECDCDAVFTYVSPRIKHLLGFHPHDIVGRPWNFLAGIGNALTARLSNPAKRAPFRGLRLQLVDKDGGHRHFLIQGLPVFDRENGALMGFRGSAQDISDYVERDAAMQRAVKAADAANRAKSDFLANMSHELRTPLNAIIGFSEIMAAEKFGPIENDRYLKYLGAVLESGRHLLNLINQVLDVAKIEAGGLELIEGQVNPEELLRAALRVVSTAATDRDIEIRDEIAQADTHLWADEGKLRQILLNLLSNAVKFTPEGGHIEAMAQPDSDGSYLFRVSDTGIGIDPEDIDIALAPFRQVDSYLTRRVEGTGLGLPLSKSLAEAHGGSLTLDSSPGKGTSVTLRLPAERVRQD